MKLTDKDQIDEFGGAVPEEITETTENHRSAALARRARLGDYDEGMNVYATSVYALINPA